MISEWGLYWILMLDSFKDSLIVILVICGFLCFTAGVVVFACMAEAHETEDKQKLLEARKLQKRSIHVGYFSTFMFILTFGLRMFLPSTKQMVAIMVIPKIVNSKLLQTDAPKEAKEVYSLFKSWLKSHINEDTYKDLTEKVVVEEK